MSDSLMSSRMRQVMALDPGVTALTFGGAPFPWSFYADAVADLESLVSVHPGARRIGIVLRNRPRVRWPRLAVPAQHDGSG
jgi:long-chain acyl-CoA synthetase